MLTVQRLSSNTNMNFLSFLFVLVFSLIFLQKPTTAQICPTSCPGGGPKVKFPFGLNPGGNQSGLCSYPGFGLSCSNKTGTLALNLPESGEFTVIFIDYRDKLIFVADADDCLHKRFLQSDFNLSKTPFRSELLYTYSITFFNCSTSEVVDSVLNPISCLSNDNYSVVTSPPEYFMNTVNNLPSTCHPIKSVTVPISWSGVFRLEWYDPDCSSCTALGGDCGFINRTAQEIGCFNTSSQGGLPKSAKYGIIIGVGIPGVLSLIGLVLFLGSRARGYARRRNLPSTEFSTSIPPVPAIILAGLDGSTIESYPKIKLGDSGRLPKANDNTCPICLSEYQPKETLRTIPECNHYFHANCVDEWLRMKASCPLCRKSPGESAAIKPSISTSVPSSSLLSA